VEGNVRLWDLSTGKRKYTFDCNIKPIVHAVFSKDGKQFLACSAPMLEDGKRKTGIWSWETATGKNLRASLVGDTPTPALGQAAGLSPLGDRLLMFAMHRIEGKHLCTLQIRDLTGQAKDVVHLVDRQLTIRALAVSADGRKAVTAGSEKTDTGLLLWDLESGTVQPFKGSAAGVSCLAFSANGQRVLAGGDDKVVRVWDVAAGKAVNKLVGHTGAVTAVAFSPDGRWALSGSLDRTARLWDVDAGREICRFAEHTDAVLAVAFAPNHPFILSGGVDKVVRVWPLPPKS
jgi:WD40 repeat protein